MYACGYYFKNVMDSLYCGTGAGFDANYNDPGVCLPGPDEYPGVFLVQDDMDSWFLHAQNILELEYDKESKNILEHCPKCKQYEKEQQSKKRQSEIVLENPKTKK